MWTVQCVDGCMRAVSFLWCSVFGLNSACGEIGLNRLCVECVN